MFDWYLYNFNLQVSDFVSKFISKIEMERQNKILGWKGNDGGMVTIIKDFSSST